MLGLQAATVVSWGSARETMRRAQPRDRNACRPAIWMTFPAVVVPCLTVAVTIVGVSFDLGWLAIPVTAALFLNLVAIVVVLLSFAAYPGSHSTRYVPRGPGTARSAMFRLRMVASAACAVTSTWSGVVILTGLVF